MDEHRLRFQKRLDRLSRNDPYLTMIDTEWIGDSTTLRDEDVITLGLALQTSTHVTRLTFNASKLMSLQACSTVEEYLKSTRCLENLVIDSRYEFSSSQQRKLVAKVTHRLLSALLENKFVLLQDLTLSPSAFCCRSLSQYLSATHSLQVLRLTGVGNCNCSDLNTQTIGKAINQCQTLKEIDLGRLSQSWLNSIFQFGLTNHPSVQKLSLRDIKSPDWTATVATAFRQVLFSSTPLQSLQLDLYKPPHHGAMQDILEGLWYHPTIKSLKIDSCKCFDIGGIDALEELFDSSNPKLETLFLNYSIENPSFFRRILEALQQNTTIQHLDLTGYKFRNEGTLIETILRNNTQITHLSLKRISFEIEAAISFMKTVFQAPSLTKLDIVNCHFGDAVFESLASWSSNQKKESVLQTLSISASYLLKDNGMQHLMTVLRRHTPQLRSLLLHRFYSMDDGALQWAKSLQTLPLEILSLMDCDWREESTRQIMIPMILENHPTLKCFEIDLLVRYKELGRLIQMVTETVENCQLQRLYLDIGVDYDDDYASDDSDNDSFEEEDSDPDYDALVQAFASNTTVTEVYFSNDIFDNCDTKKLYFYGKRNEEFQKITSKLMTGGTVRYGQSHDDEQDEESNFVNNNNNLRMVGANSSDVLRSSIPLGLWPHILQAAHRQFPDLSMLQHLLTIQTDGSVLSGWETRVVSTCTTTNQDANSRCTTVKRDHSQISAEE
jgi:hypothetical protein